MTSRNDPPRASSHVEARDYQSVPTLRRSLTPPEDTLSKDRDPD